MAAIVAKEWIEALADYQCVYMHHIIAYTYIQLQSSSIPTIMRTQVINYVIQKSNQTRLHNPHITIPNTKDPVGGK
jgi:hypothetical protein